MHHLQVRQRIERWVERHVLKGEMPLSRALAARVEAALFVMRVVLRASRLCIDNEDFSGRGTLDSCSDAQS